MRRARENRGFNKEEVPNGFEKATDTEHRIPAGRD